MKIVSFDIGIKNMAYCVLVISDNLVHIVDWNVINLSMTPGGTSGEMENSVAKCNCVLKKGSAICGKKAQYFHVDTLGQHKLFCGTHAKSHSTLLLPKKEYELSQIKKKKVGDVGTWYQSVFGTCIPAGYKKEDMVTALAGYYRDHCFTKVLEPRKVNAKDLDLIQVGRAMKHHFDVVSSFSGADRIVIENQISTIATRMKTIQGMVAQYFIMRNDTATAQIEFVSSVNKLKGFASIDDGSPQSLDTFVDDNYDGVDGSLPTVGTLPPGTLTVGTAGSLQIAGAVGASPPGTLTSGAVGALPVGSLTAGAVGALNPDYKKHKSDGVRITQGFIVANSDLGKWGEHFEKHKKRDDLADCFLQAIWYGSHNKIFSYADNLKINSV